MVVDSNIFIEHLRAKNKSTTELHELLNKTNQLFISAVSVFELYTGAVTAEKEIRIQLLIEYITILPFTYSVSLKAAQIFHQLKAKNQLIEFRDIFIGATCINHNLPIKTLNRKHFERINGLEIA